ncbi:MerR family transcriptional regulator [Ruegeria arenilitoris]|uniref:MerR family regulatory protein n=1 Tax=Ruegeria arenilitoris TaxID=1173585 RepID=A0A238JWV2_9RHOB|nr:MerR family transcriptional regulator [Ruegeria arenilitoris]SMX35111.1 MerR family regulatory protein [Ruegeria arenilitoris]
MSKSPDAFRTISEVADWLGVQAHVLRFWESRFAQVKPVKRAGGRRYYRPNDMRLLGGIKKLLHEDGITIKGVQRILREQGVAHVAALSPEIDVSAESPQTPQDVVVSFPPKSTGQQIDLDLQADPDGPGSPEPQVTPSSPHPEPTPAPAAVNGDDGISPAPLFGGIASKAWQTTNFDAEALRQIAPIARDLRAWLSRVEGQKAG